MSSDATSGQHADFDGYLHRAELLADLGRYGDAVDELRFALALAPADGRALVLLARVQLAAQRPDEALTAADTAVSATPDLVPALVARGMALLDLSRFDEAAQAADRLLDVGRDDPYALRSAAAILSEARNGQQALNVAWRGVELAPEESDAHLVLSLVAARLHVYDLAERGYREALRLDPDLADARHDVGVIRLEQRRYATELEYLAEAAAIESGRTLTDTGNVLGSLGRMVRYGAGYGLVTALLVAIVASGDPGMSRVWAALLAITGFLVLWVFAARVPGSVRAILPGLLRTDRALALSVYAVAAAPCLLLLYTLVGTPWPLVLAIAAGTVAEFAVLRRAARI